MSSSMVSVYKAVKQEMSAEEVEGVEHGQYSGEGSLCWLGLTAPDNSNLKLIFNIQWTGFTLYMNFNPRYMNLFI